MLRASYQTMKHNVKYNSVVVTGGWRRLCMNSLNIKEGNFQDVENFLHSMGMNCDQLIICFLIGRIAKF